MSQAAQLIGALVLERARVLYLLKLSGLKTSDLDTADVLNYENEARAYMESLITGMRLPNRRPHPSKN